MTGPGGVGKTTVAHEVCRQLQAADVAHAMIDTDELDRVYPPPGGDPHKTDLTRRNLAAVWSNLRDAGAPRLILTMVAVSLSDELANIREAIPEARIVAVRLYASEDALLERVRRREVGSGYGHQAPRSIGQSRVMGRECGGDRSVVDTTARSVPETAREVLDHARRSAGFW
ncbi:AAA family ATPase [Rubrobacter tropicus]|uniref:AAA family ATPase n=1 Tax=Rubrobacter tropicus TaxID=2653851 RepID=UPI001D186666|nr:AAA family ATPase [Rubrobacter tropicus]